MEIVSGNDSPFDSDPDIENAYSRKDWDEARRLIEKELVAVPEGWFPLVVSDKGINGSFWDLEEFQAYSLHHRGLGESRSINWIEPSYSKRWWQLAVINRQQEKYEEAIDCVERGLQLEPDHPYLWMQHGLILSAMGQYDRALFAYQAAESVHRWSPGTVRAWALRSQGYALIELGRLSEAKSVCARALELEPGNEIAENELGYVEHLLEEQEQRRKKLPTPADFVRAYLEGGKEKIKEILGNMPEEEDDEEE